MSPVKVIKKARGQKFKIDTFFKKVYCFGQILPK